MTTVIIASALLIAATLVVSVCGAALVYVQKCDEKTKEEMGIRI